MTHPIIKTDNYILITSDEEIQIGDVVLSKLNQIILFSRYYDHKLYKKVIAHLPQNNEPILEGVPLLPPLPNEEDDLDKESDKYAGLIGNKDGTAKFDFKRGYKKAKEKYKFTEEDVIKAIKMTRGSDIPIETIIQSISQPKLPVGFKCEMNKTKDSVFYNNDVPYSSQIIINGVMQGEWIF